MSNSSATTTDDALAFLAQLSRTAASSTAEPAKPFTLPAELQTDNDAYFEEFQASLAVPSETLTAPPAVFGPTKKTAFQLKKEAERARKKKDEEEAAKAYEEFAASFETSTYGAGGSSFVPARTWVKGATIAKENSVIVETDTPATTVSEDGLYRPHMKFAAANTAPQVQAPPVAPVKTISKKRALDEPRPLPGQRLRLNEPPASFGSHDTGDRNSTNLFVGNLHPSVTEQRLCSVFAEFGPIGSVKIMWPRTQEEIDRERNTGFVGFMKRDDAERAVKGLDGFLLEGKELRVGWGKAVPIPEKPIFVSPKSTTNPENISQMSGLPFNAQIPAPSTVNKRQFQQIPRPEVRVRIPENLETLMRINRCIEFILVHGLEFELLLMEREKGNPDFSFLFEHTNSDHVYYRWKLYSLLNGDSKSSWQVKPFGMFDEGPVWIPPAIPDLDDEKKDEQSESDSESDSSNSDSSYARHRKQRQIEEGTNPKQSTKPYLTSNKRRLHQLLRQLTNSRASIAEVMLFCLSHANSGAASITNSIYESLTHPSTQLPQKIARLHLVSDILHNSANPRVANGWRFRAEFEKVLTRVFVHFGECWRGIAARLRAEQWKRGCLAVVGVWERWCVYDSRFLEGLRMAFQEGASDVQLVMTAVRDDDRPDNRQEQRASEPPRGEVDDTAGMEDVRTAGKFMPIGGKGSEATSARFKPIALEAAVLPAAQHAQPQHQTPNVGAVKKASRVVAGAASVFQADDSDSE
ncbi:U2 snRNP-associated SURP domain-containing protein [Entophlyctis luteolus]|nr:U2 snRNP-associated SURP domain-containing protein [Entophlyctis luteolus]